MKNKTKYIFVTGGVLSGIGKGIAAASIAKILQISNSEKKTIIIKNDGYFNFDPGTQNPSSEHGETFVLENGTETDLDLGHYERFLNTPSFSEFSITSGKVISKMLEKERRGDYLGKTVQVIPHLTGLIRDEWEHIALQHNANFVLVEIGGTCGDLESIWFIEAARELVQKKGKDNVLFIHLGYIPEIGNENYQKTKPLQQSIQLLRERGIFPDILIGRSKKELTQKTKQKLNWLCNIPLNCIFSDPDLDFTYELPLFLEEEGMAKILSQKLDVKNKKSNEGFGNFGKLVNKLKNRSKTNIINIGICGKYTDLHDSYISVKEALVHASTTFKNPIPNIKINFIDSENKNIYNFSNKELCDCDGIIIPGGFGSRGVEGKIKIIQYCRENNVPFLGICYGLQLAVVEFARNICKLRGANTTEVNKNTKYNVIDIMPDQKNITEKGGTMRLGSQEAFLKEGSQIMKIYNSKTCKERHRHRYEVNPNYHDILEKNGLILSGKDSSGKLVEFIEYPKNDFFVATQAHPELKSTLESPAPLFVAFLEIAGSKRGNL